MQYFRERLDQQGYRTDYIKWSTNNLDAFFVSIVEKAINHHGSIDWALNKRIKRLSNKYSVSIQWLDSQLFINSHELNRDYLENKKKWLMADFYKYQRKRLDILVDGTQPRGGKWSFDGDNRKKIPIKQRNFIPELKFPATNQFVTEAILYVNKTFKDAWGQVDNFTIRLRMHRLRIGWKTFCKNDSNYSVPMKMPWYQSKAGYITVFLTPMLNIGLLTPMQVVKSALDYAYKPRNSHQ